MPLVQGTGRERAREMEGGVPLVSHRPEGLFELVGAVEETLSGLQSGVGIETVERDLRRRDGG